MTLYRISLLLVVLLSIQACTTVKNIGSGFTFDSSKKNGLLLGSFSQDEKDGFGVVNSVVYFTSTTRQEQRYSIDAKHENFLGLHKDSDFEKVNGNLFVVELPEGKYQLTDWLITLGSAPRLRATNKPPNLEFEITANEITYIGSIHMNLILDRNLLGLIIVFGGTPEIRDESIRDINVFKQRFTKLQATEIKRKILKVGLWDSGTGETGSNNTLCPCKYR